MPPPGSRGPGGPYGPPPGGPFGPPPGGPPPGGPGGPLGPPPGGFGPRPKRKSPLLPILLGGGGFCALIIIVIAVIAATTGDDDPTGQATSTGAVTTSASTTTTTSASSSASGGATFSFSSVPTSTSSSSGSEGTSYGTPENHKIYRTGTMKSVRCTARLRSTAAGPYSKYVRRVTSCLNKTYKAQLARQGMEHRAPSVVMSRSKKGGNSPCSSSNIGYVPAAFYCSANETMYYNLPEIRKSSLYHVIRTPAHEYAHHVQAVVGISEVRNERHLKARTVSARTRLSRRMELQAQCFAGSFLAANSKTMNVSRARLAEQNRHGDESIPGVKQHPEYRTHGNGRNNFLWTMTRGWNQHNARWCNTWSASAKRVA